MKIRLLTDQTWTELGMHVKQGDVVEVEFLKSRLSHSTKQGGVPCKDFRLHGKKVTLFPHSYELAEDPSELVKKLWTLKAGSDGDKIYWKDARVGHRVMAKDHRFLVCVRSAFGTANYSCMDLEKGICGTISNSARIDWFDPADCQRLIAELHQDDWKHNIIEYRSAKIKDVIDFEHTFEKVTHPIPG